MWNLLSQTDLKDSSEMHRLPCNCPLKIFWSPDVEAESIRNEHCNFLAAQQQIAAQLGFGDASSDVHLLPCNRICN